MIIIDYILSFLMNLKFDFPVVFYSAPVVMGILLVISLILYRYFKQARQENPQGVSAGRVKGMKTFMIVSAVLFGVTTLTVVALSLLTYLVMTSM